jgi:hypothetical protein
MWCLQVWVKEAYMCQYSLHLGDQKSEIIYRINLLIYLFLWQPSWMKSIYYRAEMHHKKFYAAYLIFFKFS